MKDDVICQITISNRTTDPAWIQAIINPKHNIEGLDSAINRSIPFGRWKVRTKDALKAERDSEDAFPELVPGQVLISIIYTIDEDGDFMYQEWSMDGFGFVTEGDEMYEIREAISGHIKAAKKKKKEEDAKNEAQKANAPQNPPFLLEIRRSTSGCGFHIKWEDFKPIRDSQTKRLGELFVDKGLFKILEERLAEAWKLMEKNCLIPEMPKDGDIILRGTISNSEVYPRALNYKEWFFCEELMDIVSTSEVNDIKKALRGE
jgi:hypothetical protein